MNDRAITVSEAARRLKPFISRAGLYKWIERGDVEAERSPTGGRLMIRESEVVRILAWYEGIDPEVVRAKLDAPNPPTPAND